MQRGLSSRHLHQYALAWALTPGVCTPWALAETPARHPCSPAAWPPPLAVVVFVVLHLPPPLLLLLLLLSMPCLVLSLLLLIVGLIPLLQQLLLLLQLLLPMRQAAALSIKLLPLAPVYVLPLLALYVNLPVNGRSTPCVGEGA